MRWAIPDELVATQDGGVSVTDDQTTARQLSTLDVASCPYCVASRRINPRLKGCTNHYTFPPPDPAADPDNDEV